MNTRAAQSPAQVVSSLVVLLVRWSLVGLLVSTGCSQPPADDDATAPSPTEVDDQGPDIDMTPIPDGQPLDQSVPVVVRLKDSSGISSASLYYRAPGTDFWGSSTFLYQQGDQYAGTIPGSFVRYEGVDYYVEATDGSPNHNVSQWPEGGAGNPAHFDTEQITGVFPYVATFEPPEPTDDWRLEDTGWRGYVFGFDDGENWHLCADDGAGHAACHDHGSPYQTEAFLDYLVSPPIDLSGASAADLYWREYAYYSQYAQHQLLISAGHPNPASGDYQVLYDPLPVAPEAEGAWARSFHVDLSEFVGEPVVYLAFSYAGMWGDDWYLDDISVTEPVADLRFDEPVIEPAGTDPGGQVSLAIDATNAGLVSSSPLTASVTSPDGQVTISPADITLPEVPAGDTIAVGPFSIQVDPTHADDVYIPVTVVLSDGDNTWSYSARIQVGQPPVARIDITHEFEDDLQIYLGYGSPSDPDLWITVQEDEGGDSSGTFHWDVDISDYTAALPPDADHRWFLEVWDDSVGNVGQIDAFRIQIGEATYESTGLPDPIPDDGTPVEVYIPDRADLELRTAVVDPEPAAPGAQEDLRVILNNTSAAPHGTLTGELHAISPDVTLIDGGPMTMTYTPVASEDGVTGIISHDLPFQFQIAGTHTDSTAVLFNLIVTDGLDVWSVPIQIEVPYPVLAGLGLEITDTTGDSALPEALEPGETAGLTLRIRNTGGLATFDQVHADIRIVSDSGAGAVVEPSSVILYPDPREETSGAPEGAVTPTPLSTATPVTPAAGTPTPTPNLRTGPILPGGGGKSDLLAFAVAGGVAGDTIQLEITVSDGTVEHVEQRTITLSEIPWNPLTAGMDRDGDAQDYPIDLAEGSFRLSATLLDLIWRSYTPFDIDDTYLYSFISSKAEYQYAIVYVYGEVRLYRWYVDADSGIGYWYRRYSTPESLTAAQTSDTSVELRIDLADIGMVGTELYGGASVGACDGGLACDYAPDDADTGAGLTRFYW